MVNPQALSEIVTAITTAKHRLTKVWILKILERFAKERFDELRPVYEELLKSDPETFVIYQQMAPEEIAKRLQALKEHIIKQDRALSEKFMQLAKEIASEMPPSLRIYRLFE
jgi:thymidylate kinase